MKGEKEVEEDKEDEEEFEAEYRMIKKIKEFKYSRFNENLIKMRFRFIRKG